MGFCEICLFSDTTRFAIVNTLARTAITLGVKCFLSYKMHIRVDLFEFLSHETGNLRRAIMHFDTSRNTFIKHLCD